MKTLAEDIKKYGRMRTGKESINKDGIRYRYDMYIIENVPYWMIIMFKKIRQELRLYKDENYTISLQVPKFKGEPYGNMILSELVIL